MNMAQKQFSVNREASKNNVLSVPSLALVGLGLAALPAGSWELATNVTFKAEVALKETYDSNVFIQDNEPLPANVAAAKAAGLTPVVANKGSFVTSVQPKIGLDSTLCPALNGFLGYAPEIVFYHSARSEDYTTHRGTINLGGKVGDATWELANTASYIDGSTIGPTFARPDDIPAVGGIPLRDRRAAFIFRNGFRLTEPVGDWFFRPVANAYVHDFKTDQLYQASKSLFAYENYIDRQDISGGLDVGYQVAKATHLVLGYRYGQQNQYTLPGAGGTVTNSPFNNSYHRILLGVEGMPASWLKLALLAGPDFRNFQDVTPAGFRPSKRLYYVDASITVLPAKDDAVTLKSTRFEQPAFSSFSMYEDTKIDLSWRHQFSSKLSATAGFTVYIGDWQQPARRDDWIYTPNISATYVFNKHLSVEAGYSYDWVD
ncbi:MAG: outer membrane beta-barrel protein, partial [Verrucomicrobia bacterium]|nr:outer membrane beta-barrel protein [Verrucomicrobiota bacterium]